MSRHGPVLLTALIRRVKHDSAYTVDGRLTSSDLTAEVYKRSTSFLRAQWALRGVRGGRLRFAETGTIIRHRRHLRMGAGCVVEAHAQLSCLSSDGFHFGDRVTIGKFSILEASGVLWNLGIGLRVGDDSSVGDYCFLGASGGITIGRSVLMGQRVSIHSQNHNYEDPDRSIRSQGVRQTGVVVGDDCWLGSGSIILDGVVLGEGCVVSAGAVVTKSFPPRSIIAGVPARLIGQRGMEPDVPPA